MALPNEFQWLADEPKTRMIEEALHFYGTTEDLSPKNNNTIMAWAVEVGGKVADVYKADSIPWCGLFMALVAKRAKKQVVKDPLWALNWGTFGKLTEVPMLGDVLVFNRITPDGKKAGHVGLYVGENTDHFFVLGGNQNDSVCIKAMEKSRLYICRRPNYNIQPLSVTVRIIDANINSVGSLA
ncbi:TIGR02594 family protein [Runella limosa]|uniref:TIGR02594 family protein n=1 Tax=Runella limosa TaxID=370978 RepID=UPI00040D1826|nr:TIGR02594 family protein [Runella limosa]